MKKPQTMLDSLGVDVKMESENIAVDYDANHTIHRIGRELGAKAPGCKYVGSVCVHFYIDKMALTKDQYDIVSAHQITMLEDVSENLIALGMNNAVLAVRQHFNPEFKHKTNRKGDKRGSVK